MPLVTGCDREACSKLSPWLKKISYYHIGSGIRELLGFCSIWIKKWGVIRRKLKIIQFCVCLGWTHQLSQKVKQWIPSNKKKFNPLRLSQFTLVTLFHIISSFQKSCKENTKNLSLFQDSTIVTFSSFHIIIWLLLLCMCACVCMCVCVHIWFLKPLKRNLCISCS